MARKPDDMPSHVPPYSTARGPDSNRAKRAAIRGDDEPEDEPEAAEPARRPAKRTTRER